MIRQAMLTMLATVIGLTMTVVVSSPVDAVGGCVTRAEYDRVHAGMTKKRVEHIFGTSGRVASWGGGWVAKNYIRCSRPQNRLCDILTRYEGYNATGYTLQMKGWNRC